MRKAAIKPKALQAVLFSALCCFLLATTARSSAQSVHIRVAATSDLTGPLTEIAQEYEHVTGNKAALVFGASGTLYEQIKKGAQFDVFLSADKEHPKHLTQENFVVEGMSAHFANAKLVLWVRKSLVERAQREGLKILAAPEVKKIAIANPKLSPFGISSVAAMESSGITAATHTKLAMAENVSQAAQFAAKGTVDAAMLSATIANSEELKTKGDTVAIPDNTYPPLEHWGAVLAASKQRQAAVDFMRILLSPVGKVILRRHGFFVPEGERNPFMSIGTSAAPLPAGQPVKKD